MFVELENSGLAGGVLQSAVRSLIPLFQRFTVKGGTVKISPSNPHNFHRIPHPDAALGLHPNQTIRPAQSKDGVALLRS